MCVCVFSTARKADPRARGRATAATGEREAPPGGDGGVGAGTGADGVTAAAVLQVTERVSSGIRQSKLTTKIQTKSPNIHLFPIVVSAFWPQLTSNHRFVLLTLNQYGVPAFTTSFAPWLYRPSTTAAFLCSLRLAVGQMEGRCLETKCSNDAPVSVTSNAGAAAPSRRRPPGVTERAGQSPADDLIGRQAFKRFFFTNKEEEETSPESSR